MGTRTAYPHRNRPYRATTLSTGGRRLASALALLWAASGCNGGSKDNSETRPQAAAPPKTTAPAQPVPTATTPSDAPEEPQPDAGPAPHEGPWFVVTSASAGIYATAHFKRTAKLGWARNGARVPVDAEVVSKEKCSGGWYRVIDGGFVCGNQGTIDPKHPSLRFSMKQPDWEAVLPYKYVRNSKNGTPLYRSVPSREQMHEYEPYLLSSKKKQNEEEETRESASTKARPDAGSRPSKRRPLLPDAGNRALRRRIDTALLDAGILLPTDSEDIDAGEPETPWWQREDIKDELHTITLDDLKQDADDILAKRMVTGFYVAVDKTFRWNGRLWYKTTRGLVAPSDRFWAVAASKFEGVQLGEEYKLPVAWVYGWRKRSTLYEIDTDKNTVKAAGKVDRFEPIQLSGKTTQIRKRRYRETSKGLWVRDAHIRVAEPGPPPEDLKPLERWIDINLKQQTLVAFDGTRPAYATLISSGKESKIKAKDHRTPVGSWRIREKHLTTTMDGDGTAAGDLPYSIEDVPYVMYFHRSYAVHGAFWHRNFGVRMSHGCVNLAPLDAKWVFLFTRPSLQRGRHGVWAQKEVRPGSRVVIHR